ncbi:hypothetical protein FJNA_10360 [Thermus sp. FJN-A]
MWTRRKVLASLLGLLGAAWADEDEGKGKEKEERKGREGEKGKAKAPVYGLLEGVEGNALWVAGRRLEGTGELVPFLAPGMVVGVEEGRVRVVEPRGFAYFQGPGGWVGLAEKGVRSWWVGGRLWKALKGSPEEALVVARWERGQWQDLPASLRLPPAPREGWWRLAWGGGGWRFAGFLGEE